MSYSHSLELFFQIYLFFKFFGCFSKFISGWYRSLDFWMGQATLPSHFLQHLSIYSNLLVPSWIVYVCFHHSAWVLLVTVISTMSVVGNLWMRDWIIGFPNLTFLVRFVKGFNWNIKYWCNICVSLFLNQLQIFLISAIGIRLISIGFSYHDTIKFFYNI